MATPISRPPPGSSPPGPSPQGSPPQGPSPAAPAADISHNLVLAVIASSSAPILLLDGQLSVIAASHSFCSAFELAPVTLAGRPFFGLGAGEWDVPQLRSLLKATAAGNAEIEAYEMDLRRAGRQTRRLVLHARRMAYGDDATRIVLTVVDVTDARVAERVRQDLLREMDDVKRDRSVLLQEMQHRVANSLQIIASVLLQTARRVQSDETRSHLHEAHQRVMSVASLQRQLSLSAQEDVCLRAYFTDLCESIGASMIRDPTQIALEVDVDDSTLGADISVSLGLIVTELVINALKHAFPEDRHGRIVVGYCADGTAWTLSVADDGVGMSPQADNGKTGLGTSIVTALARQLRAVVHVRGANPGTVVSIVKLDEAETEEDPALALAPAV